MLICSDEFDRAAAEYIRCQIEDGVRAQGFFCLCLSGGSTPLPAYARLAQEGCDLPWDEVVITFGDERCVPPDHKDSNFRTAQESLLSKVPIPPANVLRIRAELSPQEAADDYEQQLETTATRLGVDHFKHDLMLLGMGDDGHTASLFPGTKALEEPTRKVVANHVPRLGVDRITMTLPFINESKRIAFLIRDQSKRSLIDEILSGTRNYPASLVRPQHGDLDWILGWVEELA